MKQNRETLGELIQRIASEHRLDATTAKLLYKRIQAVLERHGYFESEDDNGDEG